MSGRGLLRMRSKSSSDALEVKVTADHKDTYRIVVMGAAGVGKTCIINRFLYENFEASYKATIEELHRGEYAVNGATVTLDILDTTGSYAFPAMRKLSITTGDAFILVYSLENEESFEEVKELRQLILDTKESTSGETINNPPPIVIVGNKLDILTSKDNNHEQESQILETVRDVPKIALESVVSIDWNHGYVEASAKDDVNINGIFKELLAQCQVQMRASPALIRKDRRQSLPNTSVRCRRRNSCRVS